MATVTWNPSDKGTDVTLSNGNLTLIAPNGYTNGNVRANRGVTSGKWYWEIQMLSGSPMFGISNSVALLTTYDWNTQNVRMYWNKAKKYPSASAYGATVAVNDIVSIALDVDNGTITFYKNGVYQGVAFTNIKTMGIVFPYHSDGDGTVLSSVRANFGATPFSYPEVLSSLGEGWKPYHSKLCKYLLQNTVSNLFTIQNGALVDLSTTVPTEALYIASGFSYPLDINGLTLDNISDYKLLMYTDDETITEATLKYECEPYQPISELTNPFKLLLYKG